MAADPKSEQIIANLVTLLGGITAGADYHFTVDAVVKCAPPQITKALEGLAGKTTVYLLTPADEDHFGETFDTSKAEMRIDVLVAHRFEGSDDPTQSENPDRWTYQNRLVCDAMKRINRDCDKNNGGTMLGGLVTMVRIPIVDRGEDGYVPNWAIAFLRLVVDYSYADQQP